MATSDSDPGPKRGAQNAGEDGLPELPPDFIEQIGDLDNIVPTRGYQMTPLVGLGGSAGGLTALQKFFEVAPTQAGITFVVILHLSPDHESALAELLGRSTTMPVTQAEDGVKMEPNHVYVIPPGKHIATVDGHLRLTNIKNERGKRVAVDFFFRTLADTHGPHAAAVVLSGADGDGAIGIKRIKERGGLTIAQDPDEAEHSGMPRSAIDTGMVDWVLPAAEIPKRLEKYLLREKQIVLPPEEGPQPAQPPRAASDSAEAALRDVLLLLRARTGRDFTYYKRATILRRIGRRMQVNGMDDLPVYLEFLRIHPGEAGALLQDLLISVTNFFRDRDAFETLEMFISELFKHRTAGESLRVWVPACATGEEAYSVAMLLLEQARRIEHPPALQVFACDLDDEAIQQARAGLYPDTISADVTQDRLRRFFVKEARGYRVRRELREMVLFASHDLLKDAPFSRMDLISCRNLLIYLNREAQTRALEIFHFALRPQGLLFLGSSESVDEASPLFRVRDKKYRIYSQQPNNRPGLPIPSGPSTLLRSLQISEVPGEQAPAIHGRRFPLEGSMQFQGWPPPGLDRATVADLHYRMIERLAPPSIIVNGEHDIVHVSEHAGRFLQVSGGEPTINLLRLVHPMLRIELRSALFRAVEANAVIEARQLPFEAGGERRTVDLRVTPAPEIAPGFLLVVFDSRPAGAAEPAGAETVPAEMEPLVHQLERHLEQVKTQLRDTVEQHEASTEEMKASNEELQAMNEELRSATEELETSREELQSMNEELATVNHELKGKVEEIAHANSDLQNLMAATSIPTIFLDRELSIKRFTPPAVELFHLIPTDLGRPLADLKHRLDYPGLIADCDLVLKSLVPIEREVRENDRWFLTRLQPYRTLEEHIGGIVLTCVDVTARRSAEARLADDLYRMERLRKVSEQLIPLHASHRFFDAILAAAIDLLRADGGTIQLLDRSRTTLELLATSGFQPEFSQQFRQVDVTSGTPCGLALDSGKRALVHFDQSGHSDTDESNQLHLAAGFRSAQSTPLVSRTGLAIGMLSTHWHEHHVPDAGEIRFLDLLTRQAADAIERWQVEEALRQSEERLRLLLEGATDHAIFTMDPQRSVNSWNAGAEAMFGYRENEILGQPTDLLFTAEDRAKGDPERETTTALYAGRAANERWHSKKDGGLFYGSGSVMPLRDRSGVLHGFVKIMRDLTESKRQEEESREQMEELKRFNSAAVDRELRVIELKTEINELCQRLGQPARYSPPDDAGSPAPVGQ